MKSLRGHFLIASPRLADPNFFHAVVLLVEHNEQGAFGVVLNRPLDMTIDAAWAQISQSPCAAQGPLYHGGPCDGPLMVVHSDATAHQIEILPGVYVSTDKQAIEHLVAQGQGLMKFLVGYAGWGEGQLENEMEQGGWLTLPATGELVFSDNEAQWDALVKMIARSTISTWVDPKIMPEDPSMN